MVLFELDQLPCGILTLSARQKILAINLPLRSWLGYSEQFLLQQDIYQLLPPASRVLFLAHVLPAIQHYGKLSGCYLTLRKQNGHQIDMLASGKAIAPEHAAAEPTYQLALLPVPKN